MMSLVRFLILLLACLALLAWGMWFVVTDMTQGWFSRDISLRARLAVNGSRQSLVRLWPSESSPGDPAAIRAMLIELTHDERILAAAACSADATLVATTEDYPLEISCADLAARARPAGDDPDQSWLEVSEEVELAKGPVHVSAIPIVDGARTLGCVILVHDLSFVSRREERLQSLILVGFGVLALTAVTAGFGHFALPKAFAKADATAVMPLDFTRLPFAALFGYILFGEISDAWTWAGAVIIFVAGLMVTRREKKAPA